MDESREPIGRGRLRQDPFAHENERVLDVVLMGHAAMWAAMRERDALERIRDASRLFKDATEIVTRALA